MLWKLQAAHHGCVLASQQTMTIGSLKVHQLHQPNQQHHQLQVFQLCTLPRIRHRQLLLIGTTRGGKNSRAVRLHAPGISRSQGLAKEDVPTANAKILVRKTQDADTSFSVNILDFACFTMVAQLLLAVAVV